MPLMVLPSASMTHTSAAAMTDPNVFFDAVGDDELLARRQQEMFESVQRFIDMETIEVIPTSRYVM